MKLRYAPRAKADIAEIHAYINDRNARRAARHPPLQSGGRTAGAIPRRRPSHRHPRRACLAGGALSLSDLLNADSARDRDPPHPPRRSRPLRPHRTIAAPSDGTAFSGFTPRRKRRHPSKIRDLLGVQFPSPGPPKFDACPFKIRCLGAFNIRGLTIQNPPPASAPALHLRLRPDVYLSYIRH